MSSPSSPPAYYPHHESYFHPSNAQYEFGMKALISSTWHVLEQPPPPSLREILSAYKSKGDGDRDMLIAMLNAKSAEDQRLASIASLHRTMLEMHQASASAQMAPSHITDVHASHSYQQHFPSPPTTSYHHSPPLPPLNPHLSSDSLPRSRHHRAEPSLSSTSHLRERDHEREIIPASPPTRKRRRSSRSPPPRSRTSTSTGHQMSSHDLPLSPYSSTSSHSSSGSPRSRESMAIGSLLSETQGPPRDVSSSRRTSSERSTRSISPLRR
ncbi:hypothetical protein QCA50_001519 [Cerrena zonata]|uniref:Uncharacterized protein n=1 Tax=Cerrena zonata TaxID=2478898 RepID=A0AAW0GXB9_9APHY